MNKGSIRRALFIYSVFLSLGLAAVLVTFASLVMLKSTRRAHGEVVRQHVRWLAHSMAADDIYDETQGLTAELSVTTGTTGPISLQAARSAVPEEVDATGWLAVAIPVSNPESYLVYRLHPQTAMLGARGSVERLIAVGLGLGLFFGLLLYLLLLRLLLPQLSNLQLLAEDPAIRERALESEAAPNEIASVGRAFRTSLRALETEREKLKKQHQELEHMQDSLLRASKLAVVGRLAAGVAHEIGNPLAAVLGYLSLLKMGLPEKEQAEVLERTHKELQRIHETIRKLLTYARPDEVAKEPAPLASGQVVHEALVLVRSHPLLQGLELVEDFSADDALDAVGHEGPFGQVIVNLVLNAAHALSATDAPQIRLSKRTEEGRVVWTVSDNGPGISAEHRSQVFDPFFTTKPPGEGTGLGLAVSRSLMERMGGDLLLVSQASPGTTFEAVLKRWSEPNSPPAGDLS